MGRVTPTLKVLRASCLFRTRSRRGYPTSRTSSIASVFLDRWDKGMAGELCHLWHWTGAYSRTISRRITAVMARVLFNLSFQEFSGLGSGESIPACSDRSMGSRWSW